MNTYLLLFLAFLLQEPISTNVLLLHAYQSHHLVWVIHLLFVIATLCDIAVFYYLGVLTHQKYKDHKFVLAIKKRTESFLSYLGKNNTRFALFLYGPIIFPLSAFIAPWVEISFWDSFIFLFLGDLLFWYGALWFLVLGVKTLFPDPHLALVAIFVVSVLTSIGIKYLRRSKQQP